MDRRSPEKPPPSPRAGSSLPLHGIERDAGRTVAARVAQRQPAVAFRERLAGFVLGDDPRRRSEQRAVAELAERLVGEPAPVRWVDERAVETLADAKSTQARRQRHAADLDAASEAAAF